MTLTEHLGELRSRLIVCLLAFFAAAIVTYVFYPQILNILRGPYCQVSPHHCSLYVSSPVQKFGVRLNYSAYGGLVLASPAILYQLWRFVTPGLKANERRLAVSFSFSAVALFGFGAYVAFLTFPHTLGFLNAQGGSGVGDLFQVSQYLNLILALMAIFGLTFEFPVVLVGLEMARVLTPDHLRRWRRGAIVAIVAVAAIITPSSDPFSMLAMAIPMLVFYETSILIGRFINRRRSVATA